MPERLRTACKDCGGEFFIPTRARELDIARGLSAPERCPTCRQANRRHISAVGQAYWEPRVETDDTKRCWGQYGLGRLAHSHAPARVERFDSILPDLPLRIARNEPLPGISDEDKALASRFVKIAPVAERLLENLLNPTGTRVSVLVGPTGTGKSTWVPYRLLRSELGGRTRILVTQPRLITLRQNPNSKDPTTTPGFIAARLMKTAWPYVGPGQEIGVQYKGTYDQKDTYTRLLFVTDGTLIPWIESGQIADYGVVFVDEAHEQSRNMELIFALLRARMPLWPHLRLVIASATVDTERFREYFGNGDPSSVFLAAPEGAASDTTATPKVIYDRFLCGSSMPEDDFTEVDRRLSALEGTEPKVRAGNLALGVAALVRRIVTDPSFTRLRQPMGDILVFVPRTRDIQAVIEAVAALHLNLEALPCHAQIDQDELVALKASERRAEKALRAGQPTTPQRVIVATNFAETSVTMPNIRFVIDSGLILQPRWDPETCSTSYEVMWHSQDGCKQRKGRVGRLLDGEVFRLYSRDEHDTRMREHTAPEITRAPLDEFLISAKAAGIDDLQTFEWLGKTDPETNPAELHRALSALSTKGAVDGDGDCTHRGIELAGYQVASLDHALCMSESDAFACTLEMATFLGFVGRREPLFASGERGALAYLKWREGCLDDLEMYLRIFHQWSAVLPGAGQNTSSRQRSWCNEHGLRPGALLEIADACKSLVKTLSPKTHDSITWRELDLARLHRVRAVIARCLPEWVFVRDPSRAGFQPWRPSQSISSQSVVIDKDSACSGSASVSAFVSVGRTKVSKTVFVQHIVVLDPGWLPLLGGSPVAVAALLRQALRAENGAAAHSARQVVAPPVAPSLLAPSRGERLTLRVIRKISADDDGPEGGRSLLCDELQSGQVVIVNLDSAVRFDAGDVFQADVIRNWTSSSESGRAVPVTQATIIEELIQRGDPLTVKICGALPQGDGVFVEVEPQGVKGLLHVSGMGAKEQAEFLGAPIGTTVTARIAGRTERGLRFVTTAVAEGRAATLTVGEQYRGTVLERTSRQDGTPSGVRIEILPGRTGFLPLWTLGMFAEERWREIKPGDTIDVVIREPPEGRDCSLTLPIPSFTPGMRVSASVVRVVSNQMGPFGAELELAPDIRGWLFWKSAPRGFLGGLGRGKKITVTLNAWESPDHVKKHRGQWVVSAW